MILRLIKGASYTTSNFSVKNGETVNVSGKTAESLLASGHFDVVDNKKVVIVTKKAKPIIRVAKAQPTAEVAEIDFNSMKVSELDAYAKEHGITFKSGMNKAQKVEHLRDLIASI